MKEKFYCPVDAIECPYYTTKGECLCENPTEECDDAAAFAEEDAVVFVLADPP